jgi:hypothetical protein
VRAIAFSLLVPALLGCGSKSGLGVPSFGAEPATRDAGTDAGAGPGDAGPPDAGSDAGTDAGPEPTPCVEVPHAEPPRSFTVSFEARIVTADIVFLVDNTGSMGPSIDAVEEALRARLIPGLLAEIPDVQLAIASYRDFGFRPFGNMGDTPFTLLQESTDDADALQLGVERMYPRGGGDIPEAAVEALYQLATGEGLEGYVEPASCEPGRVGAACLRPDSVPIVLVFTDAPFHNGPSLPNSYADVAPPPATYEEAVAAMNAIGMRVLGMLAADGFMGGRTRDDLEAVARDTGAVTAGDVPLVLDLDPGTGGRPLIGRVLDAVDMLVNDVTIDVSARVEDVEGDEVDATRFVAAVEPVRAIPAGGAVIRDGRFEEVEPGTRVEFRLRLWNDFLPPAPETRAYPLRVVLRSEGATLTTRELDVLVPGDDGMRCE